MVSIGACIGLCLLVAGIAMWIGIELGRATLCDERERPYVQVHPDDYAQLYRAVEALRGNAVSVEDILVACGAEGFREAGPHSAQCQCPECLAERAKETLDRRCSQEGAAQRVPDREVA